jgi:lipopolysaccharide biosynthesis glycosyltransferase
MIDSLNPWAPELEFVSVSELELSRLKVDGHITCAAYYRLSVGLLLPHNIKTALYLDSDIIINGSILDLLHTDISNYVLAAVPDVWLDRDKIVRAKICLKEEAHYLNSGVLLLNLERWRSEKIGSRALKFCISSPDSITYHDQCALNHIIQGKFYVLDKKWNFQVWDTWGTEFHSSARTEASSAPIIHFTTHLKPWNFMYTHPMKYLYFKFLKHTEWRDFIEIGRTPRNMVKRYLRIHFPLTSRRVEATYMLGKRVLGPRGKI